MNKLPKPTTPQSPEGRGPMALARSAGSDPLVIKDNHSNMCRQILVNGGVLFSITAMDINTIKFVEKWHSEWRTLLSMPWGFYKEEISIPLNK